MELACLQGGRAGAGAGHAALDPYSSAGDASMLYIGSKAWPASRLRPMTQATADAWLHGADVLPGNVTRLRMTVGRGWRYKPGEAPWAPSGLCKPGGACGACSAAPLRACVGISWGWDSTRTFRCAESAPLRSLAWPAGQWLYVGARRLSAYPRVPGPGWPGPTACGERLRQAPAAWCCSLLVAPGHASPAPALTRHHASLPLWPPARPRLDPPRPQSLFPFQVNIPSLAQFEWHPFTISSAPGDTFVTVGCGTASGELSKPRDGLECHDAKRIRV
jgi:hypothetical protein